MINLSLFWTSGYYLCNRPFWIISPDFSSFKWNRIVNPRSTHLLTHWLICPHIALVSHLKLVPGFRACLAYTELSLLVRPITFLPPPTLLFGSKKKLQISPRQFCVCLYTYHFGAGNKIYKIWNSNFLKYFLNSWRMNKIMSNP